MSDKSENLQEQRSEQIVAANEIEQLARLGKSEEAAGKAKEMQQLLRMSDSVQKDDNRTILFCGISLVFLFLVFGYVYFAILRPFDKMKKFAKK